MERPGVYETNCTFCNGPYDERRPPCLVPGARTVYGHQACINASTLGMKAIMVQEQQPEEVPSIEELLVVARRHLDTSMSYITVSQVELVGEVLQSQTAINEALAQLREAKDLVQGA